MLPGEAPRPHDCANSAKGVPPEAEVELDARELLRGCAREDLQLEGLAHLPTCTSGSLLPPFDITPSYMVVTICRLPAACCSIAASKYRTNSTPSTANAVASYRSLAFFT